MSSVPGITSFPFYLYLWSHGGLSVVIWIGLLIYRAIFLKRLLVPFAVNKERQNRIGSVFIGLVCIKKYTWGESTDSTMLCFAEVTWCYCGLPRQDNAWADISDKFFLINCFMKRAQIPGNYPVNSDFRNVIISLESFYTLGLV